MEGLFNLMSMGIYLGSAKLDDEINWADGPDRNSEKRRNAACSLALESQFWKQAQCS